MASLTGRALDLHLLNSALFDLERVRDTLNTLSVEPDDLTEREVAAVRTALGKVIPAIGQLKQGIDHEIIGETRRDLRIVED